MAITMHTASVPAFAHMLANLTVWLDKAQAHAQTKKFDPAIYLEVRLAPDMLPFKAQVQIACDTAKFAVARLAGVDAPKFEDTESSLVELQQRVRATVEFIRSVPASRFDGSEVRDVVIPRRHDSLTVKGQAYLEHFALPNFYFHATTAYALLRHSGVELGKSDFLGGVPQ
jgi:hypothetical protein